MKRTKPIFRVLLVLVMTVSLAFAFGLTAFASTLEDCDYDGYDDSDGSIVPWAGFDGTKGDEFPANWDGKNTYVNDKGQSVLRSYEYYYPKTSKTSASSKPSTSASSQTSPKPSTAPSSSTPATAGGGAPVSNTTSASKAAPTAASDAGSSDPQSAAQPETVESSVEEAAVESEPGDGETPISGSVVTGGEIDVREADGEAIHAGSKLNISLRLENAELDDLEIEIHSDPVKVEAEFWSESEGILNASFELPASLPAGEHKIVVLRKGETIAEQAINVGAKPADTFLAALTVGFNGNNPELVPGLLILLLLAVGGVALLPLGRLRGKKSGINGETAP